MTETTDINKTDDVVVETTDIVAEMTEELAKLEKDELIEMIIKLKMANEKMKATKKVGRKEEVLALLEGGINNIDAIAKELGITNKNVSSQLTYLRKDLAKENKAIISYKLGGKTILELRNIED